ncbi:MAG: hypothetical protein IKX14_08385 [Neisseriaceae bacterium]|nr:hypothetical protein [Neisseriaceae bacterium]
MWLGELANKIHLGQYNMLYLFIFLLFSGIYRIYDGKRRLLFEQQPDDRINSIPDEDVVQLWHNLTKFNIKFGHFFKKYGLFISICAIINLVLFFETHLTIQELVKDSGLFGFLLLFILLLCCFLGTAETDIVRRRGLRRSDLSYVPGYRFVPLNFILDKENIIAVYKLFHFYKREDWHKLASLDEQRKLGIQLGVTMSEYNLFHGESYKELFEGGHLNKEKQILIGATMKYVSWILLIAAITVYHGVKYYLINYV